MFSFIRNTVYLFFKFTARIALKIYYPEYVVEGKEHITNGPVIVVSNHPNTLIDPLITGISLPYKLHFLANAGLFASPISKKLFTYLFCIPVERPQDVGGRKVNNKASFAKCIEFLQNGGALWIAPEGGSEAVPTLRPLKTGTARIALATEAASNYSLGLHILPMTVSYESPGKFRSAAFVAIHKPIKVSDYANDHVKDSFGTAKKLTQEIKSSMSTHLIPADQNEFSRVNNLSKLNSSNSWVATVKYRASLLSDSLKGSINTFGASGLNQTLEQIDFYAYRNIAPSFKHIIYCLLLLIPACIGFLLNVVPTLLIEAIIKWKKPYIGYYTTFRICLGLFLFPICYLLVALIIYNSSGFGWFYIPWVLFCVLTGISTYTLIYLLRGFAIFDRANALKKDIINKEEMTKWDKRSHNI